MLGLLRQEFQKSPFKGMFSTTNNLEDHYASFYDVLTLHK